MRSEKLENGDNNKYDIDLVIRNTDGDIKTLIEVKFIRYKKHNKDKGSWIADSHNTLQNHYDTIVGCYAILAGNWSKPSIKMMESKGETIIRIEFDRVADAYLEYGVDLRWGEQDDNMKKAAFDAENKLSNVQKEQIGNDIIRDVLSDIDDIANTASR